MRKIGSTVLVLMFLLASALAAQEQPTTTTVKRDKAAEQKAAMEAMMRAATPGPPHKKLAAMAGTFDAKVKMWMEPGATPTESSGTSTNELILGGRWLQQRFEGSVMGQPFSGVGYTGYDNIRKMYVGTWMDSMSTSIMSSSGNPDGSGKTWMFSGTMMDPVSGEPVSFDQKMTMIDNDHQLWEMWGPGPDGSPFKMMEISYSRKK